MKEVRVKRRTLLLANIILMIISIIGCKYIFEVETTKKVYAAETVRFLEESRNPVFAIERIELWSSAYAVDNSEGNLKDIDISQFTDIILYIDNKLKTDEITAENTVSQLFIDNIKIESESENGERIFNYKNPYNAGKYVELSNWQGDGILFNVLNTNEKNRNADYDNNAFYTDCSNPISLGFINKNVLTGCEVNNNGSLTFDGSILERAGIELEGLKATISFVVHIINNYEEAFLCDVSFDIDLTKNNNAIYTGFAQQEIKAEEDEFNFIKVRE